MADSRLEIILSAKDTTSRAFKAVRGEVEKTTKSFFSLQQAGGYLKAAFAGLAAAGIGAFVKSSLDAADAIGKTADSIGISTDALQEYRHAANLSGVDTALMQSSFQGFAKRLGEARQETGTLITFLKKYDERLLENLKNSKSTSEALDLIFEGMSRAGNATDKAALAAAAFGKTGVKMVNFVKAGAEGLAQMRREAQELGLVLDEKFIRASENANDQLEKLTRTLKVQATTAVVQFAPQIAQLAQVFTEAIVDMRKSQQDLAGDKSLETWADNTADVVAFVADVVGAAYGTIAGTFKAVGKTLAAGSAQIAALIEGDFKGIVAIGKHWQDDMDAIFVEVGESADRFRKKLDEIRSRRTIAPTVMPQVDTGNLDKLTNFADIDMVAGDVGGMFKIYDAEMAKRLARSQANWEQLLGADTGIDFVAGDLGAMFEFYDEQMQQRLDESKENWQQLLNPEDVDFVASDIGAMFEFYDEETQKRLEESQARWDEHNRDLVDLTQHTAESMQDTFSDVFFDAMTGELKSFEDYADAVFKSISRAMADLLSKQLVEGIFGAAGGGGGGGAGGGGIFASLLSAFLHEGGVVGRDPAPVRRVPAAAFVGAPRLHDGLMPNEFAAILKKDEGVFTKEQMKALGGRSVQVVNNFNISTPAGNIPRETQSQLSFSVGRSIQRSMERNS